MHHGPPASPRLLILITSWLALASLALAEPTTVRDDLGQTLSFNSPPQRIVSLSPGLTETLFALGLDDAVVGVSDFCNYPDAALAKPRVGGIHPNFEAIVALKPDLVVSTGGVAMRETATRLERFGIPMLGFEAETVEAVLSRIALLGQLTGRQDAATDLVATLRRRLNTVMARVPQGLAPRVVYLVDEEPYITVGPKSFLYDVLIKAGGRPFETSPTQSYPRISLEAIIAFNPEVIFFSGDSDRIPEERVAAWQRWRRIAAVRRGRLYAIPRDLLNRPGPRIIDAIEYMASILQARSELSEERP